MRLLQQNDPVITPSGKRAQVTSRTQDGFCHLRYLLAGPDGVHQETCLHETLLRLICPGREAPAPVRVDAQGRRS